MTSSTISSNGSGTSSNPFQTPINHLVLVLDSSSSMRYNKDRLIEIADAEIRRLAAKSRELGQQTRISVYTFDDDFRCIVSEVDVEHTPSIKDVYRLGYQTSMIACMHLVLDDAQQVFVKYGKHAFMVWCLTDGQENPPLRHSRQKPLAGRLETLPSNWTVAALVPDIRCAADAKAYGFPAGNIAQWDVTSDEGVRQMGSVIASANDSWMTARTRGVDGTRTLFATGKDAVNTKTVKAAKLDAAKPSEYSLVEVQRPPGWDPSKPLTTRDFAEHQFGSYITGRVHYALTKPETIQAGKVLLVMRNSTKEVFQGRRVRELLGLSDVTQSVKPDFNKDYTIFVQSKSPKRHLVIGTDLIWWNS